MSSFKPLFAAALVAAALAGACDAQHAADAEPSGIELVLGDVLGQSSGPSSPGGFMIRGLDSDVVIAVSEDETCAADGRPSRAIQRRVPPGLYSVAPDARSSGAASRPQVVLVTPARFSTVRVQNAAGERIELANTM